jgi:hypothetical protein
MLLLIVSNLIQQVLLFKLRMLVINVLVMPPILLHVNQLLVILRQEENAYKKVGHVGHVGHVEYKWGEVDVEMEASFPMDKHGDV